jgi:hypothetical protein
MRFVFVGVFLIGAAPWHLRRFECDSHFECNIFVRGVSPDIFVDLNAIRILNVMFDRGFSPVIFVDSDAVCNCRCFYIGALALASS